MLEHSGLVAHYRAEREGADRLENLNELINAAASFVHEAEDDSLTAFLAHASLEAGEHQAGGGQDALQLMTVHSAKGLEFHSVFLSGLEEGLFPHDNSRNEDRWPGRGATIDVRCVDPGPAAVVFEFRPKPHAARPDPIQYSFAFLAGDSRISLLKWLQPVQKDTGRESASSAADYGRARGPDAAEPEQDSPPGWRIGQNVDPCQVRRGRNHQLRGQRRRCPCRGEVWPGWHKVAIAGICEAYSSLKSRSAGSG